jgi:hypothetical protein
MCWKTMGLFAFILVVCIFMATSARVDKEGFVTYVVYGPGGPFGSYPGMGRGWGGPNGWPYGYRPYWGWRRHMWRGPCPGPWCPYY